MNISFGWYSQPKVSVTCSFSDLRTLTSSRTEGKRVLTKNTDNFSGFEGYFEQLESKAVTELSKRTVTDKKKSAVGAIKLISLPPLFS